MSNLLTYCGLVVARISASENELPAVQKYFIFVNVSMVENIKVGGQKKTETCQRSLQTSPYFKLGLC